MDLDSIVNRVKGSFPGSLLQASVSRGEIMLHLRSEDILPVCRFLHNDSQLAFDYLVDLFGVDFHPRDPRFQVVYHLRSLKTKERLWLKVSLPAQAPRVASLTPVWKAADWLEREAFDMFGITFEGHPDLRRILLPPDWQGYPLRKDYPLRG
ncbi:MAG: hypothetical protein AMJ94_01420 [Deltaproteobacteria bacterium SM23_61]|nr:MAG: hypothetical protein AMJ94_01420 [Deltaproteobacteria bacterium SM23_61]